jgi:DNA polymerase elongation subunit (family B)
MNYQTARSPKRLFFDIETEANPENLALMPEPKAPGNLKDPEKIRIAIEEKQRELIEGAALDPDYGRVLSIGYATAPDGPVTAHAVGEVYCARQEVNEAGEVVIIEQAYDEKDLLVGFWRVFEECAGLCVGFNILGFDLPYLLRRSMALGVKVNLTPNMAKYRTDPTTDLMMILYNWEYGKWKGLKQVAKLYKIPNECPDLDGSQIAKMDLPTLAAYQASDVKLVLGLYNLMNGVYFRH